MAGYVVDFDEPSSRDEIAFIEVWESATALANVETATVEAGAILVASGQRPILRSEIAAGSVVYVYVRAVDIFGNDGPFLAAGSVTVPGISADDLDEINDAVHGARGGAALHTVATATAAGFMSAADKAKLDGIAAGAQVNRTNNQILNAWRSAIGDFPATNDPGVAPASYDQVWAAAMRQTLLDLIAFLGVD